MDMSAKQFIDQLKAFKSGQETNAVSWVKFHKGAYLPIGIF